MSKYDLAEKMPQIEQEIAERKREGMEIEDEF
jgi:hypothetical protein